MAIIRSVIVAARISSLQAAFSRLTGLGLYGQSSPRDGAWWWWWHRPGHAGEGCREEKAGGELRVDVGTRERGQGAIRREGNENK